MTTRHPPVICLAGATASGKSAVALRLAQRLGAEIVSADSMQVYRGLDIGTAKPSADERALVPHHLIDVASPDEPFDAARWLSLAHRAVLEAHDRNHAVILCGGTGLYFRAFLDGLGDAPPPDQELRAGLEATPIEVLLGELAAQDPQTLARLDQDNKRRVIRAVEILRLSGRSWASQRAPWMEADSNAGAPLPFFGLERQREDLHARIGARVDAMFAAGLVQETRRLLANGLAENRTAMQAIGYRQVAGHLRGELGLPETIELVKQKTRQFARRQLTWFRHQAPVTWINVAPAESPETTTDRLLGRLG